MKRWFAFLITLILCCMLLGGCHVSSSFLYEHADQYVAGGATLTETIKDIDIHWVSGEVEIKYHTGDAVMFSEEANRTLSEGTTLHHWLEGSTLHIQFAKSGRWDVVGLRKTLTVWVPEWLVLESLAVEAVSADVFAVGIAANCAQMDTISGDVVVEDAKISQKLNVNTTSGEVEARIGALHTLRLNTVSGDVAVTAEKVDSFAFDSVSGEVVLTVASAPQVVEGDTVSGNVVLYLPEDAAFAVAFDSTSGDFYSEIAVRMEGNEYIGREGGGVYDIDTVSGDLHVKTGKS